jgi:hypothetical protein
VRLCDRRRKRAGGAGCGRFVSQVLEDFMIRIKTHVFEYEVCPSLRLIRTLGDTHWYEFDYLRAIQGEHLQVRYTEFRPGELRTYSPVQSIYVDGRELSEYSCDYSGAPKYQSEVVEATDTAWAFQRGLQRLLDQILYLGA